jgi:hypothetical protein
LFQDGRRPPAYPARERAIETGADESTISVVVRADGFRVVAVLEVPDYPAH